MSASIGGRSTAETREKIQADNLPFRIETGNTALVKLVFELAWRSRQLRSEICFSKVQHHCVQIRETLNRLYEFTPELHRNGEIFIAALSDLFFSLAVSLERHRQFQDSLAGNFLSILCLLQSAEDFSEEEAIFRGLAATEGQLSQHLEFELSLAAETYACPAVDRGFVASVKLENADAKQPATHTTGPSLDTNEIRQKGDCAPSTFEFTDATKSCTFLCNSSEVSDLFEKAANLSLEQASTYREQVRDSRRQGGPMHGPREPIHSEAPSIFSSEGGNVTPLEPQDGLSDYPRNEDSQFYPSVPVHEYAPPPQDVKEGTHTKVDVFDFAVTDSNQRTSIKNASNQCTLQRQQNRIHRVPSPQICRALRSLGRGATACIVLFLLERARSKAHWRQRLDAIRSLRWFGSLLGRDELRPLLPGLASGLGSIILGDAQTRAVVIAEGALCFSALLRKALSLDGSEPLGQVDFEQSPWKIIPRERETFKAAAVPVENSVSSQASMEAKDNWIESVAPKLKVLLRRILVENNGSFSLHDHASPLVQFAGARLCVEILIQTHKQESFAEFIPMIFASLAYHLTSERVNIAAIARKYLSYIESSLELSLAETALDWVIEELEENHSKVACEGTRQMKFLKFMAGLCGHLGQLHHAAVPVRLMRYFERNRRVLDILLAALDTENEAGNQSIRLWKQCTDDTGSVQNARESVTCYIELVYFLGSVGALDAFADYIIAMLESACADITALPLAKLMILTNRFMQGALSSLRATDERALSLRSICVDILEIYISIGARNRSMQNLVVQILQGIRIFAESNIVPASDFRRIYMHKYLGFVASLSAQTRRTPEDESDLMSHSVLKARATGSIAETKFVSRECASIVAIEAAECLCAIARAAGFLSIESLVGAQLSFLIDMVRDETALRFIFETAGPECLTIVRDEIICIARGVAFQTNESALRQLDLLDAICSLVSQHPLLKSQTVGNEDSGENEKQTIIIHFQQLVESICGAAIAALDRPMPMLRRAALKLLHTLLRSLAQRRELLLPVMAAVLDAVPRSVHQMPADVLIAACDVVEAAFEEAPWFATSRTGAIWLSFVRFFPQPVGAKSHQSAICNANMNGKQFQLARGVTWAAIARILECLHAIPLSSLAQYEEALRAACAAVQNFERIKGALVGLDYSAAKSAAQVLQSDLDRWKQNRTE